MDCPVCMEAYGPQASSVPLVLRCGHSLCVSCFGALPEPRQCPLDRVPDTRRLSDIPRNYALLEALAAAAAAARRAPAGVEESSSSSAMLDASQLCFSSAILGRSSGGAASVVEGTYRGRPVAVKVVDLLGVPPTACQALLQQVAAMVQAAGACPLGICCSYEGACLRGHQLLLVMQRCSSSLAAALAQQQQQQGGLELPQLLRRCRQVLSLLAGLHSAGLVAVDLKPSNLLLLNDDQQRQQQTSAPASSNSSSLAGGSMVLGDSQLHSVMAGALGEAWPSDAALADPGYKSPEYFAWRGSSSAAAHSSSSSSGPGGPASDMWSFAAITLHMATGKPPLSHLSSQRVVATIAGQRWLPLDTPTTTLPASLPAGLKQLIAACLDPDPRARPTAAAALEVVTQINEPKVEQLWADFLEVMSRPNPRAHVPAASPIAPAPASLPRSHTPAAASSSTASSGQLQPAAAAAASPSGGLRPLGRAVTAAPAPAPATPAAPAPAAQPSPPAGPPPHSEASQLAAAAEGPNRHGPVRAQTSSIGNAASSPAGLLTVSNGAAGAGTQPGPASSRGGAGSSAQGAAAAAAGASSSGGRPGSSDSSGSSSSDYCPEHIIRPRGSAASVPVADLVSIAQQLARSCSSAATEEFSSSAIQAAQQLQKLCRRKLWRHSDDNSQQDSAALGAIHGVALQLGQVLGQRRRQGLAAGPVEAAVAAAAAGLATAAPAAVASCHEGWASLAGELVQLLLAGPGPGSRPRLLPAAGMARFAAAGLAAIAAAQAGLSQACLKQHIREAELQQLLQLLRPNSTACDDMPFDIPCGLGAYVGVVLAGAGVQLTCGECFGQLRRVAAWGTQREAGMWALRRFAEHRACAEAMVRTKGFLGSVVELAAAREPTALSDDAAATMCSMVETGNFSHVHHLLDYSPRHLARLLSRPPERCQVAAGQLLLALRHSPRLKHSQVSRLREALGTCEAVAALGGALSSRHPQVLVAGTAMLEAAAVTPASQWAVATTPGLVQQLVRLLNDPQVPPEAQASAAVCLLKVTKREKAAVVQALGDVPDAVSRLGVVACGPGPAQSTCSSILRALAG